MRRMVLATLMLAVLVMATVPAVGQIGLKGIGGKIGYVDPDEGIESTIALGGVVDLGKLTKDINLEAELMFWSKGYDVGYWEWSYSQIYISALGKYCFNQKKGSKFVPYAGAGLGLVIGKVKTKYTGPDIGWYEEEETSESETDLGIHLLGGAYYPMSPQLKGYGEVRYSMDGADFWGVFVGLIYALK